MVSDDELAQYGRVIRRYSCNGEVEFSDGEIVGCSIDLAQVSTGSIYAFIGIEINSFLEKRGTFDSRVIFQLEPKQVRGVVQDGRTFLIDRCRSIRWSIGELPDSGQTAVFLVLHCNALSVVGNTSTSDSVELQFAIANLTFLGNESFSYSTPFGLGYGLQLSVSVDGRRLVFRPATNYRGIINELKGSRGVNITSTLVMSDVALAEIDELIGMVEDVCLLLTLACGCRVNWLFYDVTDLSGASLRSHHRDAITKPFGTLRLISSEPPEDIASFLERSYPIYKSEFDRWELNKAIEAYNDAKIETDYLEFRALKLVVVMEHLRGRYAKEQGKVNVFPQETFDARLVVLKETVKKSVQQWLPEAAAAQIEMLTNSVEGMNWYPFRRAIKEMYCEVGLQVSSRDRGRFVDIRNELVHRMDFPGNRDSDWRHYQFLMNLIGKTLLAILRYDDFYLDWTTGATEPWRTEMQMRTKLELNGREGEGHSDDVQLG